MLSDCRQKKIDLVLVKSVSRFAREVVDGLETIRKLKSIGIPVYFDMEEMNSFQPDFELYYVEYDETGVHRKSTKYTVKIKINHEDGGE